MFWLLIVIALVNGKTVRYSNVPPLSAITTKTYDLQVPGSAPIRIIEAEPVWSTEEIPTTTPRSRDGAEHRAYKYKTGKQYHTTQQTQTTINEPVTHEPDPITVYSPNALNAFLKEYADKVQADRKQSYDEDEQNTDEADHRPSFYLNDERNDDKTIKSWGLVDSQKQNHPYEDKKGWVTLEAVPWSSSKISKWQSNKNYESKPWDNNYNKQQSNWPNRAQHGTHDDGYTHNNNNNNNNFNFNDDSSNENSFYNKPVSNYDVNIRPASFPAKPNSPDPPYFSRPVSNFPSPSQSPDSYSSRPSYGYDQRPLQVRPDVADSHTPLGRPDTSDWPSEMPSKPSWNKPQAVVTQWNKPIVDPWFYDNKASSTPYSYSSHFQSNDNGQDIITDGRPGNFPRPTPGPYKNYESLRDRTKSSAHPSTHPASGDGEWVLLSTTKGYQYPKNRQRSVEIIPDAIGTRRGIRLTVLPPSNDTKINMTTSHGGLLEVESTFQSVEESHKLFTERIRNGNRTKVTNSFNKKPVRTQIVVPRPIPTRPTIPVRNKVPVVAHKQDATAVLAAVGAGMVPATMAMLVPFVAGRRRRRSLNDLQQKNVNLTLFSKNNNKITLHKDI